MEELEESMGEFPYTFGLVNFLSKPQNSQTLKGNIKTLTKITTYKETWKAEIRDKFQNICNSLYILETNKNT